MAGSGVGVERRPRWMSASWPSPIFFSVLILLYCNRVDSASVCVLFIWNSVWVFFLPFPGTSFVRSRNWASGVYIIIVYYIVYFFRMMPPAAAATEWLHTSVIRFTLDRA